MESVVNSHRWGTRMACAPSMSSATNLAAGIPIGTKYTVRQVRVIPKPSLYPPARVLAPVRELIGASQEVFAQLLAVSPMTIRSWKKGLRQPSPIARRLVDEIEIVPNHFRGRILTAVDDAGRSNSTRQSSKREKQFTPKLINALGPAKVRCVQTTSRRGSNNKAQWQRAGWLLIVCAL